MHYCAIVLFCVFKYCQIIIIIIILLNDCKAQNATENHIFSLF